jgi:hypothetical protein
MSQIFSSRTLETADPFAQVWVKLQIVEEKLCRLRLLEGEVHTLTLETRQRAKENLALECRTLLAARRLGVVGGNLTY